MSTLTAEYPVIERTIQHINYGLGIRHEPKKIFISGFLNRIIQWMMWVNIIGVAISNYKNPFTALKKVKLLRRLHGQTRNNRPILKYVRSGKRFYINFNTPGWPSKAFNRFVTHWLNRIDDSSSASSIQTLIFAITKKCGFQCEHCCEWLNLNKPETLSREDLSRIIQRFHQMGIAQVQLSGGEPLNRLADIIHLLDNAPKGIDFWLYTTGYSLNIEKANLLKRHGLTGITISLDHHDSEKHNTFRGVKDSYEKALHAVSCARKAGLLVCFSICATKEFTSADNLLRYATLARQCGVAFIQILEPKAVGHYAGKDVTLTREHQQILENFFETFNRNPAYADYPSVIYHPYNSRRFGCSGSAVDYVYVDTDGDLHNCPFCQRKLFSAFDEKLPERLRQMKENGCNAFPACEKNIASLTS